MNEQEINEKIHVEVMEGKCFHRLDSSRLERENLRLCRYCDEPLLCEPPNYCQNLSDAFLVVEELEKQGFQWTFNRTNPVKSYHDNLPYARFWQYENGKIARTGWSETKRLSESICRAALKTLENK